MRKFNIAKIAVLSVSVLGAGSVFAQAIETEATLEIVELFQLTQSADPAEQLNFGRVRVTQSFTDGVDSDGSTPFPMVFSDFGAGLRISPAGVTQEVAAGSLIQPSGGTSSPGSATSTMTSLETGNPGVFNITGAGQNATLQIIGETNLLVDSGIDLYPAGTNSGDDKFVLSIAYTDVLVSTQTGTLVAYTPSNGNIQTDALGNAQIVLGGTLRLGPAATTFQDVEYTGTYNLTVSY